MAIDPSQIVAVLSRITEQIEGPYKWHIMAAVAFILTAVITRFIFKTLGWFILLVLMIILFFGGFILLTRVAGV